MLASFSARNYKCIESIDIPLTQIHVIVGQNDSGKTSLLEAILALYDCAAFTLSTPDLFPGKWGGEELVRLDSGYRYINLAGNFIERAGIETPKLKYQVAIRFDMSGRKCTRDGESIIVTEQADSDDPYSKLTNPDDPYSKVRRRTFKYSQSPSIGRPAEARDQINTLRKFSGVARLYSLDARIMAVPASLNRSRQFRLDHDGFGLSTLLDDILGFDIDAYKIISDEFCKYFPQFNRVRLETADATDRSTDSSGFQKTSKSNGKAIFLDMRNGSIRAQQASDGAILFLGLLALMYSPKPPSMLLIEEPEKGVYPKRLLEVVELLRRLVSDPGDRPVPQIILTTHSPYLLSAFSPEEVTLLRRKDGIGPVEAFPLRDAPHIKDRLGEDEFYLGELWYNLSEEELLGHA